MFSRREFLTATVALAALTGSGLSGRWSRAAAQQALSEDALLGAPDFGNLTLLHGTDIHARTNVAIYQTSADGDTLLLMAAIYRDIVTETPDGLRFREKHLVYDTLRLPDSVICPL